MSRAVAVAAFWAVDVLAVLSQPEAVLTVLATIGVIAFAVGQFRAGRDRGLRASLETARGEIEVERQRGDRLERELDKLKLEFGAVREERDLLRSLVTGDQVSPAMRKELTGVADRIVGAIGELRTALDGRLQALGRQLEADAISPERRKP